VTAPETSGSLVWPCRPRWAWTFVAGWFEVYTKFSKLVNGFLVPELFFANLAC
jgi:hypothetical protein